MKNKIHKSNERGVADHGWLHSNHTFSFGSYHNPDMMGFGALRVINDDIVHPSMGFNTHPHNDMEIISIPLRGSLKHKDTMGNDFVIKKGEIQVMSAGTGIAHSEFNNSQSDDVNFLQIWVMPKKQGITPSYDQKEFSMEERKNDFQLIVSPDGRENSVLINQDAYFSQLSLNESNDVEYGLYEHNNGVYVFVIEGEVEVNGEKLTRRDGFAVEGAKKLSFKGLTNSEVLIMEVPLYLMILIN